MTSRDASITIRPAYADDQPALSRLAALDSAAAIPVTPLLIAEVDGELRAALSLRDQTAIADPFHRTAELVELLRVRRDLEARSRRGRRRRRSLASLAPMWRRVPATRS
jgi:hypothetical protein